MEVKRVNYKIKLNKKGTGLNLYQLIEDSGKSKTEIAEFLELETPRVIYDWLNGIKMPSVENLFNLAKFLNVQMEDILAI